MNILFLATASKKGDSINLLGFNLPIGCGGAEKNIVNDIFILRKHFNILLVILRAKNESILKCIAPGINLIGLSPLLQFKAITLNLSSLVLIKNLLLKKPFNLEAKMETHIMIFNEFFYVFLIKLLKPSYKVVLKLASPFTALLSLGGLLTILIQIIFSVPALFLADKIILVKNDRFFNFPFFNFLRSKIFYLPGSVDPKVFFPLNYIEERKKNKINFPDNDILLLYVGRLVDIKHKNPQLLLDSFKLLTSTIKNIKLLIIGSEQQEVENLMKKYKVDSSMKCKVLILGNKKNEDLPFYYRVSNLLLLTSFHEGLPNVILESLACGTPVITTDVIDDGIILDGINGYTVKSFNSKDYTESVINGIDLSKKIKPKSISLLDKKYDLNFREDNLLRIIRS